jgi:isoleucyl-tRNA synthetase
LRLLAPFVPFTAEEVYKGLTTHHDPEGSVHLQDFPVQDTTLIDSDLERAMGVAQDIVGLGRSLRQDSGLKTRQPLGRLLLHSEDDRVALVMADENLKTYVTGELNLKELGVVDDPREVAKLEAKANFRALGPRFGKGSPVAAKVITAMTGEQILELRRNGTVDLVYENEPTAFTFDEVMVKEEGVAPFVAGGSGGLTVALDTTLTEDLLAEGLCREIINKVQNLRKKSGLEVSDRIELNVVAPEHVLAAVIRFADRIMRETLANGIACQAELPYKDVFKLEDDEIGITLGKTRDSA